MESAPLGRSYDAGGIDASPGSWPVGMIGLWPYELSRLPSNFTVCDGTRGTPDMRGFFPMGVDASHAVLSSGGTASHVHPFTHESAHAITQPIFAAPATHSITQPVTDPPTAHATHDGHSDHSIGSFVEIVVVAGVGSALFALAAPTGTGPFNQALTHNHNHEAHTNNHAPTPLNLSTNVALSNNHVAGAQTTNVSLTNNAPHAGGSVDAATGDNKLPPYRALHFVMRLS